MTTEEKISAVRALMLKRKIDAWIVPSSDPHQSEYPATHWKTRAWLSGFSGSAGTLVVTSDAAGLWTDSRYFIQAEQELKDSGITLFKMQMPGVPSYTAWLAQHLKEGACVGFDGRVLSVDQAREITNALSSLQVTVTYQEDLTAQFWHDRPEIPTTPLRLLDDDFAGETCQSKLNRLRQALKQQGAGAHLISALDEIAWLFNIRGSDVEYNPVAISYAYISDQEACLFIQPEKVSAEMCSVLKECGIDVLPYDQLDSFLQSLPPELVIWLDPHKTNYFVKEMLKRQCHIFEAPNPVCRMKAMKNATELEGFRQAHIRDGAALVKWLFWLEQHIWTGTYTEVTVAEPLEEFRRQQRNFQGLSFSPIIAYQSNGAMCHYAAKSETALTIQPEGLLLIDSGAQYLDGTTDITRTIALSEPTPQQRQDFTLVLKGHIALATAKFPQGTSGAQLDALARIALWKEGRLYGHGTGHGIGHFLSVHEGPQGIRPENHTPLEPGMVCSNEPGLYREGAYGIRIENLIAVVPAEETEFGTFYQFETLSLCPIDRDLVDASLLTQEEKSWLNAYHNSVYKKLAPALTQKEQTWLLRETREI